MEVLSSRQMTIIYCKIMSNGEKKMPKLLHNWTKQCKYCEQNFINKTKNTNYCSIDCRKKYNKENRKTFLNLCEGCLKMFESRRAIANACSEECRRAIDYKKRPLFKHTCNNCKKDFESFNKIQQFCSQVCHHINQREKAQEKHKQVIPRHIFPSKRARREYIRRKRMRDNWIEDVKLNILLERDNELCQLCNEPINKKVHYTDPLAPTIDHIIPISLNGAHSYANCQLAHRKCNTAKNNRFIG